MRDRVRVARAYQWATGSLLVVHWEEMDRVPNR